MRLKTVSTKGTLLCPLFLVFALGRSIGLTASSTGALCLLIAQRWTIFSPKVSKAATSSRVNESFFRDWHVEKANPKTAVISDYLASEFTPDPEEIKRYRANKLAKSEPNYVPPEELRSLGPSPLDAVARGLTEPPGPVVLRANNIFTLDKSIYRPPVVEKMEDLVVCVECRLPSPIDLFVQRSNSIRSTTLMPNQACLRSLTGTSLATNSSSDSPNCFYILLTTAKRASVVSTVRQQIKEFSFYTNSRIGLEVEMSHSRLVVSKVLPDSQSEAMTLQLDGAEIIAVNGRRVVDLEEFQEAMAAAKQQPIVRLLLAAYRGGHCKADDAFLFDLHKSQGMKSVLSSLFGGHGDDGDRVGTASTDDEHSVRSHATADSKQSHRSAQSHLSRGEASLPDADGRSGVGRRSQAERTSPSSRRGRDRRTHNTDSDEDHDVDPADKDDGIHSVHSHASKEEDGSLLAERRAAPRTASPTRGEDWNYLTAEAEPASVVPFVTLVCMPSLVRASRRWGRPTAYVQYTNLSTRLSLQVNWTDEGGALVARGHVSPGQTHFELGGDDHVWTLAALPATAAGAGARGKAALGGGAGAGAGGGSVTSQSTGSVAHNVGYDSDRPVPFLIFRPSSAGLVDGRCVSVMWYPGTSLSVSQTVYPQAKRTAAGGEDRIQPAIHVQLMDVPAGRGGGGGAGMEAGPGEGLGRLIRKPLSKTRVLNRWRKGKGGAGPRLPH